MGGTEHIYLFPEERMEEVGNLREIIFTGSFQSATIVLSPSAISWWQLIFLCKEAKGRHFTLVKKIYSFMQICFSPSYVFLFKFH